MLLLPSEMQLMTKSTLHDLLPIPNQLLWFPTTPTRCSSVPTTQQYCQQPCAPTLGDGQAQSHLLHLWLGPLQWIFFGCVGLCTHSFLFRAEQLGLTYTSTDALWNHQLTERDWKFILTVAKNMPFAKDSVILGPGQTNEYLFRILRGSVRVQAVCHPPFLSSPLWFYRAFSRPTHPWVSRRVFFYNFEYK